MFRDKYVINTLWICRIVSILVILSLFFSNMVFTNISSTNENKLTRIPLRDSILVNFSKSEDQVIDPIISSLLIGGADEDRLIDTCIDNLGIVYAVGTTKNDFPVTIENFKDYQKPYYDIFLIKYDSIQNQIIFSTVFGGNEDDIPTKIFIDSYKNIVIVGKTNSHDFPLTNNSWDSYYDRANPYSEGFFIILNQENSSIIYSTFIGGNEGDYIQTACLDSNSDILISGYSYSNDFPVENVTFFNQEITNSDAYIFLLKFNKSSYANVFSFISGGTSHDYPKDISVTSNENILICGETESIDFPTTINSYQSINNGERDIFIMIIDKNGKNVLFSSLFGGSKNDSVESSYISESFLYLTGQTDSQDFPYTSELILKRYRNNMYVFSFDLTSNKINFCSLVGYGNPKTIITNTDGCVYIFGDGSGNYQSTVFSGSNETKEIMLLIEIEPTGKSYIFSGLINNSGYRVLSVYGIDMIYINDNRLLLFGMSNIRWNDRDNNLNTYGETGDIDILFVDYEFPQYPSQVTISNISQKNNHVEIVWEKPDYIGKNDVQYYTIYRGDSPYNLTKIDRTTGNETNYLDSNVEPKIRYYYRIRPVTVVGEGPLSSAKYIDIKTVNKDSNEEFYTNLTILGILIVITSLLFIFIIHKNRNRTKK